MPIQTILEGSAATYTAGSDWLDSKQIAVSNRLRALRFVGLTGSAAEGDMSVELFVGTQWIAHIYNTATGKIPAADSDLMPTGRCVLIPPGTRLQAITKTASGTNAAGLTIVVDDL